MVVFLSIENYIKTDMLLNGGSVGQYAGPLHRRLCIVCARLMRHRNKVHEFTLSRNEHSMVRVVLSDQ